jgi:hypothetical protein
MDANKGKLVENRLQAKHQTFYATNLDVFGWAQV